MNRVITWSLLAVSTIVGHTVIAQDEIREVRLALSPEGPSVPLLRYRLLPNPDDLKPGNAAALYYRALLMLPRIFLNDDSASETLDELLTQPPDTMDLEDAHKLIGQYRHSLNEIAIAAGRANAVWDFPFDVDGFSTLLPDMQEVRAIAWAVSLKARIQILEQDFAAAVVTLRSGVTMARHVGESGVLINSLIGISCAEILLMEIERLISSAGAPNLYWALRDLGMPLIDISVGLKAERGMMDASLPHLDLVRNSQLSDEQTQELVQAVAELFQRHGNDSPELRGLFGKDAGGVGLMLLPLKAYPAAKGRLLAGGYDPEKVEQMPVIQVVVLDGINAYDSVMDRTIALAHPPYPSALKALRKVDDELNRVAKGSRIPFAETLAPAGQAALRAAGRLDRRIAQLAVVEAIRMHAAEHQGRLPASLEEIDAVPVPNDPLTERPFKYRLEGETATLEPPETVVHTVIRYRITIRGAP